VKTVRYRAGYRKGDPDRHSYAFFVVGALVVIAISFFIGLQVGRVVEKSAAKERAAGKAPWQPEALENGARRATAADISREMSAYSEEAVRIPVVTPPAVTPQTAGDELRKTEEEATFPESLTRKDPTPQPLVKPKGKKEAAAPAKEKFLLQAAALKNRDAAERLRNRLDHAGYKAKVLRAVTKGSGEVFRVRIGPFGTREEAKKAMKAIKADLKIDVILLQG
jgi:cell division septation protein DedD